MDKAFCTPLDITQIEQNFAEINPALTAAEAMHAAKFSKLKFQKITFVIATSEKSWILAHLQ